MGEYAEERARRERALEIARVCHEANRVLTQYFHDVPVQSPWEDISNEMKEGNVRTIIEMFDDDLTPEKLHDIWCETMSNNGWSYGPERNSELKQHPGLAPWREASAAIRTKDKMFYAIVTAMLGRKVPIHE